jgi:hypothetical protein
MSGKMRRAARTDTTHAAIRDGLRKVGFSVTEVRKDFDLIAGKFGIDMLIECKTKGNVRPHSATGKRQERLREDWKGSPIVTAFCLEDVTWAFQMRLKQGGWVK